MFGRFRSPAALLVLVGAPGIVILAWTMYQYRVPLTTILLGLIATLVLAVGFLAIRVLKGGKKPAGGGIEGALKAQSEREAAGAGAERRGEVERMRAEFEKAVAQLKGSKLAGDGRGKSGKRALYALPWYLFVGPPGVGKTTALVHSGLRFPAGTNRIRGVGGTRNCDWFFSDRAILLDTAGRYTTEEEDREEWLAFLDTLREHRPERPINGVIVGFSVPDLLEATPRELEEHAEAVRGRVDELVERLGLQVPVYLLLTKTDLVPGFVEFFGELDTRGRDQVWGATFEPGEVEDAAAAVEREFDALAAALLPHRNARLSRALSREERARVYAFPLEFAALRERLARFAGLVFEPNPLKEHPVFRGFYFTSGTQEGAPIDRVIRAFAARFDLPASGLAPAPPAETKSYFLKDLFTDVVVPDQHLARRTRRAEGASRRAVTKAGAIALAVVALATLGMGQGLVRSRMDLRHVRERAEVAAPIRFDPRGVTELDLTRLEALRAEVRRLEGRRPFFQFGLDRRAAVREPAQRVYYGLAKALVGTYALERLRRSLREAEALARVPADSAGVAGRRVRLYDDLKTYLLLTTEAHRLREEQTLRDYLKGRLAPLTQHGALGADTSGLSTAADLVARQTDAFVDGLSAGAVAPFDPDARLVGVAREAVYEPPSILGIYNRIRQEGFASLRPITLADVVPEEYLGVFQPGGRVPGFYTKRGWERLARPAFVRASADPGRENWVLGGRPRQLPPEMRDPDRVFAALEARYHQDYIASWRAFLRSVAYRPLDRPDDAEARLTALGSTTDSPLGWILAVVTEQTTFPPQAPSEEEEGLAQRALERIRGRDSAAAGGPRTHPITAAFSGLHALNAPGLPTGEAAPELYRALEAMTQFGRALGPAAEDPAQGREVLETARREVEAGTRGLDPQIRSRLFIEPLQASWTLAAGQARETVRTERGGAWRAEVYDVYRQTIAGRYPFNPRSDDDAAPGDVEAFFHPESGVLAQFAAQLGPEGVADASPEVRTAIRRGREIGQALFSGGALRVEFDLQADVPLREGAAPAPDGVFIQIHGTEHNYRLGSYRPWVHVTWPGTPGALVAVSTQQGPLPPREFGGDWAVFRLFQAASARAVSGTEYALTWTFRESDYAIVARYTLRTRTRETPLVDPASFFRFSLPASLG